MPVLTSSNTITVTDTGTPLTTVTLSTVILPPVGYTAGTGRGRIVHPTVGAFDYIIKPDVWVILMEML
jgi:hypothetical protein